MKKIFFLLTVLFLTACNTASAAFTDVSIDNQYYNSISWLQYNGVVEGYSDGSFGADKYLNRAEFLKMMFEAKTDFSVGQLGIKTDYIDVDYGAWYGDYIVLATSRGIVNGYPDGTFRPANNINFAEALKIVMNTFFDVDDLYKNDKKFEYCPAQNIKIEKVFSKFVDQKSWYWPYMHVAGELCIYDFGHNALGIAGIDPSTAITRGDMAELLYRAKAVSDNSSGGNFVIFSEDIVPVTLVNDEDDVENGTEDDQDVSISISETDYDESNPVVPNTGTVIATLTGAIGGLSSFTQVIQPTKLSVPAFKASVTDSVFGTMITKISDRVGKGGFATHIYSQLQAFSDSSSYVMIIEDGSYVVKKTSDWSYKEPFSLNEGNPLNNINTPRWYSGHGDNVIFYDTNEDEKLKVQTVDMSGKVQTIYTFPSKYERIRGDQSFDELSLDGKWIAGMASSGDEQIIFALDLENKKIGAEFTLSGLYNSACKSDPEWGAVEPDWIGVSPLGKYLVVQWAGDGTDRCHGLETFDVSTGVFKGRLNESHQHGDLGLLADGKTEAFVTTGLSAPAPNGDRPVIQMHILPGKLPVADPVYLKVAYWGDGGHISCQGPHGVCLVSASNVYGGIDEAMEGELYLIYLDSTIGNEKVLRLTHHRSTECGYWVQPRASLSKDGKYVIFASDWGSAKCGDANDPNNEGRGDSYVIKLN